MNHSETEIEIIGGYEGLRYTVDGGREVSIPSPILLQELIRFPKIEKRYPDPYDPFNVDRYRIRDREPDLDNQLLLQIKSNWLINAIDRSRYNPSDFEHKLLSCCEKYHICSQSVYYRLKLMQYCRNILPVVYLDTSTKHPAMIRAFERMKDTTDDSYSKRYDLTQPFVENNEELAAYQKRQVKFYEALRRRFSEYNEAFNYLDNLLSNPSVHKEMYDVIYDDIRIQNSNNEKIRKQNSTNKNKDENAIDSTMSDSHTILTQCLFCYRFQLQKPNQRGSFKRYCTNRPECKKKDRAWRGSLISRNISLYNDDVSPSGI